MDFGYPQNLSPEILKLYITQEGVRSPFSSKVRCLVEETLSSTTMAVFLDIYVTFFFEYINIYGLLKVELLLVMPMINSLIIYFFALYYCEKQNSRQINPFLMQHYKSQVLLVGGERALFIKRMR